MSEENSAIEQSSQNYRLPQGVTLQHCAKLGIVEDKPIMFDYRRERVHLHASFVLNAGHAGPPSLAAIIAVATTL